jgi:hypothetical protein
MDGVALTVQNYAYWLHKKKQPVGVVTVKASHNEDIVAYPVCRYTSFPLLFRKPFRVGVPALDRKFQKTIRTVPFKLVHVHCPFSSAALHTPSVLVRGSTASEIITDNYNGFLVDNSSAALATRIRTLVKSPLLIRQAGQHAALTIARPWEKVVDDVLERYSHILRNYAAIH